jgi:hypothetical protein
MLDAPSPAARRKAASLFRVWQRGASHAESQHFEG